MNPSTFSKITTSSVQSNEESQDLLSKEQQPSGKTDQSVQDFQRHYAMAKQTCQLGRNLLASHQYEQACKQFSKTVMTFEFVLKNYDQSFKPQIKVMLEQCVMPAYSNLSLCYLKMRNYQMVITMANSVLVRDDSNVKNLYRRALAYHMTSKLDEAERDFIKVAQLDPTMDEECKKQLKACKQSRKLQRQRRKKVAERCINGYASDIPSPPTPSKLSVLFSRTSTFLKKCQHCVSNSCRKLLNIIRRP